MVGPVLRPTLVGAPRGVYEGMVSRGIEAIRAGEVYQVNLAHTLDGTLAVPRREFSSALFERARPWFGGHVEHVGPEGRARAVCSASPESFVEIEPVRSGTGRRVVARPMKGTLGGHLDGGELERSAKDRAELDMIVDLMRNDLGRVCVTGSVRVEERRAIERHGGDEAGGGVWQGVATVAGALRPGLGFVELLRSVFPAGSVTGAPKIRAMRLIEELEGRPRGPYCGCVGFVGDDGRVGLNVSIRTALVEEGLAGAGDVVSYSVGAGIVADSEPGREFEETMQKAGVLLGLAGGAGRPSVVSVQGG